MKIKYTPGQVKKALVAASTVALNLVAAGVFTGTTALVIQAVVSALGVYGVFAVENDPLDGA